MSLVRWEKCKDCGFMGRGKGIAMSIWYDVEREGGGLVLDAIMNLGE